MLGAKNLIGFSVVEDYEREYDPHPAFFHILGHMGYVTQSDINHFSTRIRNYDPSIWRKVGKLGIEKVYEKELQGNMVENFFKEMLEEIEK